MEASTELRMSAFKSLMKRMNDYTDLVERQVDSYDSEVERLRLENLVLKEDNERLKRFNMDILDKLMGSGSVGNNEGQCGRVRTNCSVSSSDSLGEGGKAECETSDTLQTDSLSKDGTAAL